VIIIPKVHGAIDQLPPSINGRAVRLGYSVPTSHAGTPVAYKEFFGRPVHSLGGSPQKQRKIAALAGMCVVSADCNYTMKMANKNMFFSHPARPGCKNKYFPSLSESGNYTKQDAPYLAFELSCQNIKAMWSDTAATVFIQ
jgi:hypothetical protein